MSKAWGEAANDFSIMLEEWAGEHEKLVRQPALFAKQVTMHVWQEVFDRELDDDGDEEEDSDED